ncbi:MAG: hypothetical protein ABIS84_01585 [Arachnia sp.]
MSVTSRTRHRPGLADLIRREWYMTRLDWGMRNLPSRESRHIQRDLRRDVTATAADIGMRPALADLGKPGVLAAQYTADTDPEGPRHAAGAVAAGLAIGVAVFLLMAYAIGTLDTLEAMGGGTRTANMWGSETVFVSTANEISMATTNILPMALVILAIGIVAYLLFSRIWRLARKSG